MSHFSDQSRGNYRNYYLRRRAAHTDLAPDRDERLDLLVRDLHAGSLFRGKVVLDVGCNSGAVSQEIAQVHQAKRVIGVDIDLDLIQQCGHTVQHAFSLQKPSTDQGDGSPEAPKKKKRRLASGDGAGSTEQPSSGTSMHYFPACFPALYGAIPMGGNPNGSVADRDAASRKPPAARKRSKSATESSDPPITSFPRNLVFYAANWAEEQIETDADRYDVILALSLTKWIHLHGLDDGLIRFFQKCFDCLEPRGQLVLEKQGWRGYKDAKRSSQALKDNYFKLKLRPEEDFERILLNDIGFVRREAVKDGSSSGFDRSLEIYYKS